MSTHELEHMLCMYIRKLIPSKNMLCMCVFLLFGDEAMRNFVRKQTKTVSFGSSETVRVWD